MKTLIQNLSFIVISFVCFSLAIETKAQQTKKISLQGFLKDANGKAVADGPQDIIFKLYTVESGGTAEWTESQTINIFGGVYSTHLGKTEPLDNLNWGVNTYFVGVTVQGTELTPRTELTFAPYSLGSPNSEKANTVVCSGAVGDVKYSILNPMQFAAVNGSCWVPMDGRSITGSKLATITGLASVANAGGLFLRGQEMNGSNNDPDRTESSSIATLQSDNFNNHNHVLGGTISTTDSYLSGVSYTSSAGSGNVGVPYNGAGGPVLIGYSGNAGLYFTNTATTSTASLPSNTANSGHTETRSKNLNLWTYIRIN